MMSQAGLMREIERIEKSLLNDGDERASIELAKSVALTAVEISQDTYCENATRYQLAEILTYQFRAWTRAPKWAWYFYRTKDDGGRIYLDTVFDRKTKRRIPSQRLTRREIVQLFADGWALTDCEDRDSAADRARLYVKVTDGTDRDGNPRKLKPVDWRARLEVTLRSESLPCTLENLQCFAFTKLTPMFSYRKLAPDIWPAARQAMSVWSGDQFGRSGKYRRPSSTFAKYRNTNKFRRWTVADEAANDASYQAFRALTTQWKAPEAGTRKAIMHGNPDAVSAKIGTS
jgi:hypothetical protein